MIPMGEVPLQPRLGASGRRAFGECLKPRRALHRHSYFRQLIALFVPLREGLLVRVQGSGFRVQGSGFRVQGSGFRVLS